MDKVFIILCAIALFAFLNWTGTLEFVIVLAALIAILLRQENKSS